MSVSIIIGDLGHMSQVAGRHFQRYRCDAHTGDATVRMPLAGLPASPPRMMTGGRKGPKWGPFTGDLSILQNLAFPLYIMPVKPLNHLPNDYFVQAGKQGPLCCRKVFRHGSGLGGEASTHLISLQFVTAIRNLIRKSCYAATRS